MVYITAVHMVGTPANEHIGAVRWRNPTSGTTGENSRESMVVWIRDKNGEARVAEGQGSVQVGVVDDDPPYLRTHADGRWTDNLLALPRY